MPKIARNIDPMIPMMVAMSPPLIPGPIYPSSGQVITTQIKKKNLKFIIYWPLVLKKTLFVICLFLCRESYSILDYKQNRYLHDLDSSIEVIRLC